MTDKAFPCPTCGGDTGRYDFDPQGCVCTPSPAPEVAEAVKAEMQRCLQIVDEYHGGGRSFVMRKILSSAPSPEPITSREMEEARR